ncbi:hypothetical protein Tco_0798521 [Tanacetum coccineum]
MLDSDESGVTHTEVSSLFEDLSDIGSPRADDHEFLKPEDPYAEAALQAPPSPDYVPGPEEPEQAPPSPDYVPGPELADDEIVAGDQPYAEDASPMAHSPDDVPESDPEADPEEDDDEDPEEDPIDYSADGGDDGDDEMDIEEDEDADMDIDEEDEDDEMDDEEAEEEHSAPAYPVVVALPATAPSAEETEPFETDESAATPPPHPAYRMTARISIPEPLPVPAWSDSEVARLLAISSPPASPLSPWSSSPPQIPLPVSPPPPVLTAPPPSPIRSLGYRAATIRMRAEAAATSHSLPLPPLFHSPTKTRCTTTLAYISSYFIPTTIITPNIIEEADPRFNLPPRIEIRSRTMVPGAVRRDPERVRWIWDYRFMGLDLLRLYRRAHVLIAYTSAHGDRGWHVQRGLETSLDRAILLMRVYLYDHSTMHNGGDPGVTAADRRRQRAMSELLETDRRRREEMRELRAADRTRQQQIVQTLTVVQTLQREMVPLQGLVATLQGQVTDLQWIRMTLQDMLTTLQGQQDHLEVLHGPELP